MPADCSQGKELPFLYVALPVMNESAGMVKFLKCLEFQNYTRFRLVVCVNQPDLWWKDPEKRIICQDNQTSMQLLHEWSHYEPVVIDCSSEGYGWKGKKHGVGYARKTVMDYISSVAEPDDVIVSLDADTTFSPEYLRSLAQNFHDHPGLVAIAVPYYHRLTGDEILDRAMLRYEIYMRHYFLNLWHIGSPYSFSALGSAMAVPVWAYRAIRGMTPKLSGEDFYFLQKLRKFGVIGLWNDEIVYPEARYSDRVFFGTGPALIKGAMGDWESYPLYPLRLFSEIDDVYKNVERLFAETIPSPVLTFLAEVFNETDPLQPLRENHRDMKRFIRAFNEKFDGLRILQFLKTHHEQTDKSDTENLILFIRKYYPQELIVFQEIMSKEFSFRTSPVRALEQIRDFLFRKEMEARATVKPG